MQGVWQYDAATSGLMLRLTMQVSLVRLASGLLACAHNHHTVLPKMRSNLFVSISKDNGASWEVRTWLSDGSIDVHCTADEMLLGGRAPETHRRRL